MPKKGKDVPAPTGGGIKAFFTSTTPLKDISNSAPAPATTAPPVRAKTGAVRNLKLQQIQTGSAGSRKRAAQMPGSPPGEDDVLHSGEDQEEDEEQENDEDREFIDDETLCVQAPFRVFEMPETQSFRRVGAASDETEEEDPKQKNKDRQEARKLQPSTERANYGDLAGNYIFGLAPIANLPVPYGCLLETGAVAVENNEYLQPEHIEYLQGPAMRQHARLFAIRPALPSLTLGADQEQQMLRQVARMRPQGEDDPFHRARATATDKLLYANQVLQPQNGLDHSTADLGGEWPVQMDAATTSKILHGRRHGGNKGADTTLSLFTIRILTDMKNDEDLMLIQNAYNGYAADLTYNKKLSCPCVNTERQELFTQYGNSKIVRDVNITMHNVYEDKDTRRDSLSFVDPVILLKTAHVRGMDEADLAELADEDLGHLMPHCRAPPTTARQEEENLSLHNFITSHIHVIPSRVRDKHGKSITIVVEVLRICAHIEACDPAVALVQMISSGGHSIQEPLLRVTNNMSRMLELGPVNVSNMFSSTSGAENIATLALDANIPLAFFLFLKQNCISSHESSPFAADFQCCRIDVYNKVEVALYNKYLQILKHSRRQQFQVVRTESQRDYQAGLTRAAHLPIKTKTWDFQNFFAGVFYVAIPKPVYEKSIEALRLRLGTLDGTDWHKFAEQQQAFEDCMSDDTNVYVGVHGYPLVSGYICEFNQSAPKDDEWRSAKKRKTGEAQDAATKKAEPAVIPLYLWSSPAYQLFMANACQDKDPFDRFVDPAQADNPDYESLQERSSSLTVTESTLWNIMKVQNNGRRKLNKFQCIANQVLNHYGVQGHEIHDTLKDIAKSSDTAVIIPNMHESVAHSLKALIESSANMPMVQLARGAQSLKQIARLYADEKGNLRIVRDYLALARRCTGQVEAAVSDDAVVAAIHLMNSHTLDIGLNYINEMSKRWMLGTVYSVWSNSFNFSPYCYPIQPCDAGGLDVYTPPTKNITHWKKGIHDAGRHGRGKDKTIQEAGITMNAYPKTCLPEQETRASYTGNTGVEILDKATEMTLARQTAVVMNNGSINVEATDHERSYGRMVAFPEVGKLVTELSAVKLMWALFERFVGSSGQGAGTQQDRYKTSHNMQQLNFHHTNEGPALCFASNAVSQNQHESFVRGCRCNRTPCGTSDATGCFQWGHVPDAAEAPAAASSGKRKKMKDLDDSDFALKGVRVIKHDDVVANEAYYLLEHLNRMLGFMHRGLCLERIKFSRYSWIELDLLRQNVLCISQGVTKPVYSERDIRARNFDGAFETAMMGKLTRHVMHGAFHRRMLLSHVGDDDRMHCQIEHVMLDAVKAFLFVPVSMSVVLSALQLYLALVLLDVALMIVTCMNLFYLQMANGCPLHILASVAQGQQHHLSPAERSTYHTFAEFLLNAVCAGRVMQKSLPHAFSEDQLRKLAANKTLQTSFARIVEPDDSNAPSAFLAHTFFSVDANVQPIQEEKTPGSASNGTSEVMAAWFAQQQAQAQTEKGSAGDQFWTNAVDGCGMPQPSESTNTAGHSSAYMKPQNCYKWYEGVMENAGSAHGVILKFMQVCNMDLQSSRLDVLLAILQLHFDQHPAQRDRFMQAVSHNAVPSAAWTASVLNQQTKRMAGDVFAWTVRPRVSAVSAQHAQGTQVLYNGLEVAMATDVLFVIVGQAMFAAEWRKSALDNQIVVHTRNMASAAQVLVFLTIHTAIPMAYVPAHAGVVVLSEPSHNRAHSNRPIMVPYRRYLHVSHDEDRHCFLDDVQRERIHTPSQYETVATCHGVELTLHTKHLQAFGFSNSTRKYELFTYPPESMAHILPLVEHLRDANISHCAKLDPHPFADSAFAYAVLEFGRAITAEHVMHIPSTLTDCAEQEEIPCLTWRHGFMFVLRVAGKTASLHPVAPTHPDEEQRYAELPLADGVRCIEFPTNELSYAMAHGLVCTDGDGGAVRHCVRLQPPPCGAKQELLPSLPFLMFPIVQFDTLLLLKRGAPLETFGRDPANTYRDLSIGLLCKHEHTNTYLHNGRHCVQYYDTDGRAAVDSVDFLFVSRCMLMEGHQLFLKLPLDQLQETLRLMHASSDNEHIGSRTFGLDADGMADAHTHATIKCFYTLCPDKHAATLQGKKIRVLFRVRENDTDECTFVLHDAKLFNEDFICNFHIMAPECPDSTAPLAHFVWQ